MQTKLIFDPVLSAEELHGFARTGPRSNGCC